MRLTDRVKNFRFGTFTALLIASQLLLGVSIVAQLWSGTDPAELLADRELQTLSVNEDWSSPERATDTGVLESRPLFHPSRRPPSEAAQVEVAPPRPSLRIVGTMLLPGRPAVGLLARDGGETLRVRVGDDVDGWVVREIATRKVLLERGEEQLEVGPGDSAAVGKLATTVAQRDDRGNAPVAPATTLEPRIYRAPPQ
jgi:hypothetical protein